MDFNVELGLTSLLTFEKKNKKTIVIKGFIQYTLYTY